MTKEEYKQLEETIESCIEGKLDTHYNWMGTIFSILHIYFPLKQKHVYFCSEFVSEQLRKMDSFQLKKEAKMYLPSNLAKVLSQQKNLYKVLLNEV